MITAADLQHFAAILTVAPIIAALAAPVIAAVALIATR